jgi:electron transfer flavoprotein alpha subunit
MGLKIISLMKQVPLPTEMRMGADGLMDRTKAKSIINVDCSFGLEQGLQIKSHVPDAELIVVSMGPPSFEQSLRKTVSMGYDRAVLLSDRRLGGSDTFATGLAIATLLKSQILPKNPKDPFIVFAGRQTTDGDTAHVPSQVAENLGIPQATFVEHVEYCGKYLKVRRIIEGGHQTLKVPIPCIISVAPSAIAARRPSLVDTIRARKIQIETYTLDQIGLTGEQVGLAGSPTIVAKAVSVERNRPAVTMLNGSSLEKTASQLSDLLENPAKAQALPKKEDLPAEAPVAAEAEHAKQDKYPRVDFRNGSHGILTWIEAYADTPASSSIEILNPARKLAEELNTTVTAVVIGENVTSLAGQIIAHGADEVVVVNHPRLKEYLILPFASVIAQIVKERRPEIALFAATTSGRELAPRLASRLRAGVTADCTILKIGEFVNKRLKSIFYPCLEAIRPTYGESKLATIIGFWCPQMATARPGTFKALTADYTRKGKVSEFKPELKEEDFLVEIMETQRKEVGGQSLLSADIIIAGGKPCGAIDEFKLIKELVYALQEKGIKADWGASRQAVDYGYAPYPRQIGQSGKTIRPKVYVAVAISGAIQHVCGIKESGKIIAINQDAKAAIFNCADYGIVGDYLQVLPLLIDKVKAGFTFGLKTAEEKQLVGV